MKKTKKQYQRSFVWCTLDWAFQGIQETIITHNISNINNIKIINIISIISINNKYIGNLLIGLRSETLDLSINNSCHIFFGCSTFSLTRRADQFSKHRPLISCYLGSGAKLSVKVKYI